jgi:hypothetical protein
LALDRLVGHFCFLLKPSNHFLIPKVWSGLGELPEIIDEIRSFEAAEDQAIGKAHIAESGGCSAPHTREFHE